METKMSAHKRMKSRTDGFSLLEMMIVVAILMVVFGVVVTALVDMQHRNTSENSKVDTVQETRDFIDQMVRDLHQVGYPPGRVLNGNPGCVGQAAISCGVTSFSPTQVIYEGDLDGTGTVYQVTMQLVAPVSGNCPCILQRGVVTKTQALAGQVPIYFTEVNGTINSGNGAGAGTYPVSLSGPGSYSTYSTADVFAAYDVNAGAVGTCTPATTPDCSSIRSLQITANVVPASADPVTHVFPVFSITSKARLNF
jgi:type II secretory pathway pseudopilin PulG